MRKKRKKSLRRNHFNDFEEWQEHQNEPNKPAIIGAIDIFIGLVFLLILIYGVSLNFDMDHIPDLVLGFIFIGGISLALLAAGFRNRRKARAIKRYKKR